MGSLAGNQRSRHGLAAHSFARTWAGDLPLPEIWRRANTLSRNLAKGEHPSFVVGQISENVFVGRQIWERNGGRRAGRHDGPRLLAQQHRDPAHQRFNIESQLGKEVIYCSGR